MERKELTEEERELIKRLDEFLGNLSKEMNGKTTGDILPMDIAMLVSICLAQLYEREPRMVAGKNNLMNIMTLVANGVLKYQEQKTEKNTALDKLRGKDE